MSDASDNPQFQVLEQLREKTAIVADWPYKRHPLLNKGSPVISQVTDERGQKQNYAVWLEKGADDRFNKYVFLNLQDIRAEYDKREDAKPDVAGGKAVEVVPTGRTVYRNIHDENDVIDANDVKEPPPTRGFADRLGIVVRQAEREDTSIREQAKRSAMGGLNSIELALKQQIEAELAVEKNQERRATLERDLKIYEDKQNSVVTNVATRNFGELNSFELNLKLQIEAQLAAGVGTSEERAVLERDLKAYKAREDAVAANIAKALPQSRQPYLQKIDELLQGDQTAVKSETQKGILNVLSEPKLSAEDRWLLAKWVLAKGNISNNAYEEVQEMKTVHSADSAVKANAEPVLAKFSREGADKLKFGSAPDVMLDNYVVTQARITFDGLPTQDITPAVSAAPASAKQSPPVADPSGKSDNAIVSDLRAIAANEASDGVRKVMVDKAVLKFRNALAADPLAEKPATQEKIKQGLELKGLTEAEKAEVAKKALATIDGGAKPAAAPTFNMMADNKPPRDYAAEFEEIERKLRTTQTSDAALRAGIMEKVRAFIAGKEGEVGDIIAKQKPEIQERAKAFMTRIDSVNAGLVEGTVRDVAHQVKLDFDKMSPAEIRQIKDNVKAIAENKLQNLSPAQIDEANRYIESNEAFTKELTNTEIDAIKVQVKSLAAQELEKATSPAEIDRVLSPANMNALFHKVADSSLGGLEKFLDEAPTARQALDAAADGIENFRRGMENGQQNGVPPKP